ncbi:MAG: serine/threonine-protein kinase [Planctomycetota bacterium]
MNLVGERLGRFAIERELGRGMAASVWLARDPQTLRQVALKLLHDPFDPGAPRSQRFQREVQALSSLRHPAIVPLLEVGSFQGRPFLVLGHFPGGSLEHTLRTQGRLAPRQAARTVLQLAEGLELAHAHGILHRDLNPANVLLSAAGEPALTDFGLARFLDDDSRITKTGAFYGTPGYLAPEQAQGDPRAVGVGTDVYGLGGILYACLTGQPPHAGETLQAVLDSAVLRAPRPPSELQPGVPRELDAICLRCLEKTPGRRFPSAGSVAAVLRGFLATPSERAPRLGQRRRASVGMTLALSLPGVVGGAVALGYLLGRRGDPSQAARVEAPEAAPAPEVAPAPQAPAEAPPAVATPPPPEPTPAASYDPRAAELAMKRAVGSLRAQRFDEAVEQIDRALAGWPDAPERAVWIGMRGYAFFEGKRFASANDDLSAYLKVRDGAMPRFQRGICRFMLDQPQAALADFERALELDPELHAAHYWRGAVRSALGYDRKACAQDVRIYLERQRPPHPDLEAARELLARLERSE